MASPLSPGTRDPGPVHPGVRFGVPVASLAEHLAQARHTSVTRPALPHEKKERTTMAGPVIHFEITGKDAARLQKLYTDLFGWDIDADDPLNYGDVAAASGGIGGGPAHDGSTRTTFYVGVEDLQAEIDAAEALGFKTVMPAMSVPGGSSIAMFTDPDGNLIGVMQRP
jgi:hypothetical protein